MVPRYVFFYRMTAPQSEDLERIRNAPGLSIIDETDHRALLVEAAEETIGQLRSKLAGWLIAPETTYPSPQYPRQTVDPESDI